MSIKVHRDQLVQLTASNIAQEHICCALSGGKNTEGVGAKKEWLKDRFEEGLVFLKAPVRGKVFIEFLPAESAWRPVDAPGYLMIHCLWVSGRFKGMGWADLLLKEALSAAKNYHGICVVSGNKPFLSPSSFFEKKGFQLVDQAPPCFDLMVYKTNPSAEDPAFFPQVKNPKRITKERVFIQYSNQCPFTHFYVKEMESVAQSLGLSTKVHFIDCLEEAKGSTDAYGVFSVYLDGKFLSHQVMAGSTFKKLLLAKK